MLAHCHYMAATLRIFCVHWTMPECIERKQNHIKEPFLMLLLLR
uniref:Uncharacterized protein n=1 Tax=Anguilla anguilla TaxID=7936 RepID=A0A0E9S1W3_ANGAN